MPAAKLGDQVVGIDTHVFLVPSPGGPVPTPMPTPFSGVLTDALSPDVLVEEQPIAVVGSVATNLPPHLPLAGPFQSPPSNRATVETGSSTVFASDKPVAMLGSTAMTCNDPTDAPVGSVLGTATTIIVGQ
jgi:uncharacterized Zn-binding protein involved in type VI secretion